MSTVELSNLLAELLMRPLNWICEICIRSPKLKLQIFRCRCSREFTVASLESYPAHFGRLLISNCSLSNLIFIYYSTCHKQKIWLSAVIVIFQIIIINFKVAFTILLLIESCILILPSFKPSIEMFCICQLHLLIKKTIN